MGNILSLFDRSENDSIHEEYNYLLINSFRPSRAFNISSQVMELANNFYVHDLKVVRSYWSNIAKQKGEKSLRLIYREAIQCFGEDKVYILCHHPFEGYLLGRHLIQSGSQGFFLTENKVVKNLYQNISLSQWLEVCRELDSFFDEKKVQMKKRKKNHQHYQQIERMFAGLGVSRVLDFKGISSVDLTRRFSQYIGQLFDWTFPNRKSEVDGQANLDLFDYDRDVGLHHFYWKSLEIENNPLIKTDLDYPLSHWEHIKEELIRSFDKLLRYKQLTRPNRIITFKWELILFDLDKCCVFIRFKHPVCLLEDQRKDYESLLSQFQFAFDSLQKELRERYQDYDYYDIPHFSGWNLEAIERIAPSSVNHELFSNLDEMVADKDVEAFQNKIKGSINRYSILKVDIPDLDYKFFESNLDSAPITKGSIRPFFLYEAPIPINVEEIKDKRFIERTSSNWWGRWDTRELFRDYYMALIRGELVYVFKDHLNKWYKHGIFS